MTSRMYHPPKKEEIKSGTCGCGSFVVPHFKPATSIDLFYPYHQNIYVVVGCAWLFEMEVGAFQICHTFMM